MYCCYFLVLKSKTPELVTDAKKKGIRVNLDEKQYTNFNNVKLVSKSRQTIVNFFGGVEGQHPLIFKD